VYLIADRRTLAYAAVSAAAAGTPFELSGPADGGPTDVRVELVSGAVIWYSNQLALDA
jgi:hypothetical protein